MMMSATAAAAGAGAGAAVLFFLFVLAGDDLLDDLVGVISNSTDDVETIRKERLSIQ